MMLMRALLRNANPARGSGEDKSDALALADHEQDEAQGAHSGADWLLDTLSKARHRLARVAAAPFHEERMLSLSVLLALVEARGEQGVRALFAAPNAVSLADVLLASPWSSAAPDASIAGRFVGSNEAAACEARWRIASALVPHRAALVHCLGLLVSACRCFWRACKHANHAFRV